MRLRLSRVLFITESCDNDHRVVMFNLISSCEGRMNSIVLVVDDERGIADAAAMVLEQKGLCALAAYSADEAIKLLKTMDVALILSDVNMPGIDGVELALEAQKVCPRTRVLLMSGIETSETIKHRLGCDG